MTDKTTTPTIPAFHSYDCWGKLVVTPAPALGWGLTHAVPGTVNAAYGARCIQCAGTAHNSYADSLDFVPGRGGFCWREGHKDETNRLRSLLNGGILADVQVAYAKLRRRGALDSRKEGTVTLYEDDTVKFVGDTNASCGYVYVAAWLK